MTDAQRLQAYVETWWGAIGDFTELLESLSEEDWARPTDLPGWDVRAIASHIAHLEGVTGGAPRESVEIGEPAHVTGPMGQFTEIGVVGRRDTPPAEIVAQIREYAEARHRALLADPPTDAAAPGPKVFGAIGWTTEQLLRNRPLDVWMHEQDIRRAVGRPGHLDTPGADHTTAYLLESLGYVLAKRVGAAPGTSVVAFVDDDSTAALVDENGRGRSLPTPPEDASVTLRMSRDTFIRLAGGRAQAPADAVAIDGDRALGEQIVANLAVTP